MENAGQEQEQQKLKEIDHPFVLKNKDEFEYQG